MTAVEVRLADGVARPILRHVPALLVILFLLVKVGQFTLATVALREGVSEPQFATGLPMVAWDLLAFSPPSPCATPQAYGPMTRDIAFFPVLPLISRLLIPVLGPGLAVLTVANVMSIVGLLFYAWCRRVMGERESFWACLLLIAYPPGMFLSAAYTEGVFMVTTGAALYFSAGRRPWLAALAAAVESAKPGPPGIMVSLVIVIDAIWRGAPGIGWRAIPRFPGDGHNQRDRPGGVRRVSDGSLWIADALF